MASEKSDTETGDSGDDDAMRSPGGTRITFSFSTSDKQNATELEEESSEEEASFSDARQTATEFETTSMEPSLLGDRDATDCEETSFEHKLLDDREATDYEETSFEYKTEHEI